MPNATDWKRLDTLKVRSVRIAKGYLFAMDIAADLGVPASTYAHWEAGTHRIPPFQLEALAGLLGVPVEDLEA